MAGYSKIYCIGSSGGFRGSDGLARPFFQILVGNSDRQWMEPLYDLESNRQAKGPTPKPIGDVKTLIPAGPNDPVAILDATIAFFSELFRDCPTFAVIESKLQNVAMLDFNDGKSVPMEWKQLRREALPRFRELAVFEAELKEMDLGRITGLSEYA